MKVVAGILQPSDIVESGAQVMSLFFFGGKDKPSLSSLRYNILVKKTGSSKNITRRTSTNWVVDQVSFTTDVPLNNDLDEVWTKLDPNDWEWKMLDCCYVPILSDMDPVPESLLRIIHCYCKTERTTNMMKNNQ